MFCLDDGERLLEGPAPDGPPTAVMPGTVLSGEAATRTFDNSATTNESLATRRSRRTKITLAAVAVLLIAVVGWAAYKYYRPVGSRQIESMAVMPFVNTGGNPDMEYLSDGITESLINSLSQIPELAVKARSSVFTYKGKDVSPQQVAKDLSVQAVLNGRVQQRGEQVIMNVELVDTATGNQLWGEQYTRKATDIIQLQSEIARDVSGKLRAKLTGADQEKVAKTSTDDPEAYQLYLRGRFHWNKRKPDDIRKSIEYFQQAIDKDPTYALAYASLAEAYILIPNYRLGRPEDSYPKARAAALRAIEINPNLAEAYCSLASITSNYEWKFPEAEVQFRKAIEFNPNYATAHQWYAEYLLSMGRSDEAVAEMRRALELDPLSLIINGMVGVALRLNGKSDEAVAQLQKTAELDPDFARTHLFLAETYQSLGRFDEAVDEFAKYFVLIGEAPDDTRRFVEQVKKAAKNGGQRSYSRAMAEIIEAHAGPTPPPATVMAGYWARAGETDKAFDILEKAYSAHDDALLSLKDEKLDPLKSDPRYKDLLRRVGLPE
jgi:TolB-like protein/Tfp pilus assembly protein PilF